MQERKDDRLDSRDLRLVLAIRDTGTLGGAARRLGIDHSSAFRRLERLEAGLGVRLFLRSRDGYLPTPEGELAVAAAREVTGSLDALALRLQGETVAPGGTVRLTTADTLVPLVAEAAAALRRTLPAVVLEVVDSPAFFAVNHRDADVALRPASSAPEGLVGRRLAAVAVAPYAARRSGRRAGPPPPLEERDWLGFEASLEHLATARWMAVSVRPERVVLRGSTLRVLHAAARAGVGVALLPCYLGDADPDLVRVEPPRPAWETSLWLLTHPDLRRVPRIRAVLDGLAAWFGERRALLEGTAPRRTRSPAGRGGGRSGGGRRAD